MKFLQGLALASVTLASLIWVTSGENEPTGPELPLCAEDDVIKGTGDYLNGVWDGYKCSHPDVLNHQAQEVK